MYLSKVRLQHSEQARGLLLQLGNNGAYAAHQLLWQLFTHDKKRQFLFREDRALDGMPEFLVLSEHKPLDLPQIFLMQTKIYKPIINTGDRFAYKLRVNPTISIKSEDGCSKRHDVLMHAKKKAQQEEITDKNIIQQLMFSSAQNWFADTRRLENMGVKLDMLPDIECYSQHQIRKRKKQYIKFSSVDFQGVLSVQKPDKFLTCLINGIGRSKSMGCGLMLIRRI